MTNKLTTEQYWEQNWDSVKIPVIVKPHYDIHKILTKFLPSSKNITFIEIGCAPGGWIAYFKKKFSYIVNGIDYAKNATVKTKQNLKIQNIPADIKTIDFFKFNTQKPLFNVVFSGGFIEHFKDTNDVVGRICNLSKEYVVTIIPNVFSINGLISKKLRPDVYSKHEKISLKKLRILHETQGFKTLFCDYVGGIQFIMPAEKTDFFRKNSAFSKMINIPFKVFNFISKKTCEIADLTPRTRLFSISIMYVGKRKI